MKNAVANGAVVNWTNGGSAVTAGQVVVMGHTIGVAVTNIAGGATGAVAIEGVFEVPKVSAAAFVVGEKLIYDISAGAFDDSDAVAAAGDITGAAIAMKAGANLETTCLVKLTPGNATLTAGGG
jgi:predicted RecA/RadA family phage recombinase